MKLKNIFMLLAAMTAAMLTGCKEKSPFETQRSSDAPRILTPFNESGAGTFTYELANPDTHFLDSCRVTPSSFTTVQWLVDKVLIHTGLKMDQAFLAGNYDLLIKATTTEGKETSRFGTINVMPYAEDPYSADPKDGRHFVPGKEAQLDGDHLDLATQVLITSDIFAKDLTGAVAPTYSEEHMFKFMVPQLADGRYFVRLIDAAGKVYGANHVDIHNHATALAGFKVFNPGKEWVITGVNLQNVNQVIVNGQAYTPSEATETTVKLNGPDLAEGVDYTLTMTTSDGEGVVFFVNKEYVGQTTTKVSTETTLWTGPVAADWNADLINVTPTMMTDVPVGSIILIYYDVPDAEYHQYRICTKWWNNVPGGDQADIIVGTTPNPLELTYDATFKAMSDEQGGWSCVGFGYTVTKITYK